jgi:aminopeptidase N
LDACDYIHHPLHQATSIKLTSLSLALLDEIQKTGDIFFPKRWITSTIGRYTAKAASDQVTEFLKQNPNFNPILTNKILQGTDDLMRVQKMSGPGN